jgi:hypothetical protein
MGLFSGPSKAVIFKMAQGVANIAMQLHSIDSLDEKTKGQVLASMKLEKIPTTMDKLIADAASVIVEQNMGWYRKNQYLGLISGSLVGMGMAPIDASHIKESIEMRVKYR